jgi:hypothetical protein
MSDQADHHPAEELLQKGNAAFNAGLLEVADDLYRRALPLFEALHDEGKAGRRHLQPRQCRLGAKRSGRGGAPVRQRS